jgi:GTPase-associated system helical domain
MIYPTSADFFLKETHKSLIEDEKLKVSDILTLLKESNTQLKTIFKDSNIENSRVSLLSFIKGFIWGRYEAIQIKDLVGLEDTTELTLSEFTLWIFHDFQSLKFLTSK